MSFKPDNFTVWMEIPVTDLDRAIIYYNAVTNVGLVRDDSGPNPMATFMADGPMEAVRGHLYPGKPAARGTGATIHMASPGKLEDTLARVAGAGGEVVSDPIALPMGRFAYTLDPDGNSIGFFESN